MCEGYAQVMPGAQVVRNCEVFSNDLISTLGTVNAVLRNSMSGYIRFHRFPLWSVNDITTWNHFSRCDRAYRFNTSE